MKNSKRLEVFKEALKRAKEGDLFNYDNWLEDNGVNPRTLNLKYFQNHFRANPDKMVGNEEVMEKIAHYIGHFLKEKKGIYHIPIIGINGSGKTLLLNILERFTNDFETNLGSSIDIIQERNYLLQDIDSGRIIKSPGRVRIYFIDNCEKVDNITKILENILKLRKDSVYITSWTPESWIYYREDINSILPISKEIIIYPLILIIDKYLSKVIVNEYFLFLKHLIHSIMNPEVSKDKNNPYGYPDFIDAKFFDEELVGKFHKYTKGIPLTSIKLLLNCIEKTFLMKQKEMTDLLIDEIIIDMDLYYLDDAILDQLTELHLQILSTILLETNKTNKGIRPMQLVKEFSLDKSTISYHLNNLKELELVEDERIGKSKFYKIKENLIPFVELKILKEIYLKKRSVKED